MSLDKSDSPNDESDDDGSDSGSSGTYSFGVFSLRFDNPVSSISIFGPVVF